MSRAILPGVISGLVLAGCDVPPSTAPTTDPSVARAQFAYKSCEPETRFHGPPANYSITSLLGDKDGFGMGVPEGGTSFGTFDARLPNDPLFTDVWTTPSDFTYQHTFVPPAKG